MSARSALLVVAWLLPLSGCLFSFDSAPRLVTEGRYLMGTVLEVTLVVRDEAFGRERIGEIFERVAALEALLSSYDENSEISRLSRHSDGLPRNVDPRTAEVISLAQTYGRTTGGTFDITVAPLVKIWRDRGWNARTAHYESLAKVLELVGLERVRVDLDASSVTLQTGTELDLGGIAKGYALDRIEPLLRGARIDGALVSFGQSSIIALGTPPGDDGWRLLV